MLPSRSQYREGSLVFEANIFIGLVFICAICGPAEVFNATRATKKNARVDATRALSYNPCLQT
jgi:hypothetical protein